MAARAASLVISRTFRRSPRRLSSVNSAAVPVRERARYFDPDGRQRQPHLHVLHEEGDQEERDPYEEEEGDQHQELGPADPGTGGKDQRGRDEAYDGNVEELQRPLAQADAPRELLQLTPERLA